MQNISDKLIIFNESKLMILKSLFECEDFLCGCNLVEKLDMPKNLLSYHIKSLIDLGYIQESKCGRNKKYVIRPDAKNKVKQIINLIEII